MDCPFVLTCFDDSESYSWTFRCEFLPANEKTFRNIRARNSSGEWVTGRMLKPERNYEPLTFHCAGIHLLACKERSKVPICVPHGFHSLWSSLSFSLERRILSFLCLRPNSTESSVRLSSQSWPTKKITRLLNLFSSRPLCVFFFTDSLGCLSHIRNRWFQNSFLHYACRSEYAVNCPTTMWES